MRLLVGVGLLLAAGAIVLSIVAPDPTASLGCALLDRIAVGPWCMELELALGLAVVLAIVAGLALIPKASQ